MKALPVLTAVSEQTKAMAHLDADDTKHHEDKESQGAQKAEGVKKTTDVINNQMINPFTCKEQELINISTGHKATCADLICTREKGLEALAAARRTNSEKVAQIKLSTFTAKPKKSMSMAFKAKKVYEEESAVVRNLYFVQDLEAALKTGRWKCLAMNGQVAQPPCLSQIRPLTKVTQCVKETRQTPWLQSRQPLAAHGGKWTNYRSLTSLL